MTTQGRAPRVAVFSASARPGLAQVRQLKIAGFDVRAVTRQAARHPDLADVEVVAADLNDLPSLEKACRGADVVFYTAPSFTEHARAVEHITALGRAAATVGVDRVVYNTTSWHPAEPIGVPSMDRGLAKTTALLATGVATTVVRPSLFMDNLLTRWVKPYVVVDGEFSYPHVPDLEVSWICLDDVARFMIATATRDDFEGEIVDVGGPETLRPTDVAALLGEHLGRPITYRQITPREFGERMYGIFKDVSGLDEETYVTTLERHYQFKNVANPFRVDMASLQERLPLRLTTMREWLAEQDWSLDRAEPIGSVSG